MLRVFSFSDYTSQGLLALDLQGHLLSRSHWEHNHRCMLHFSYLSVHIFLEVFKSEVCACQDEEKLRFMKLKL